MSIHLDFVGLNTLVNEEIDTTTNTIGNPTGSDVTGNLNTSIATISNSDYLVALNTHRNGPYGYPTFKQIRTHQNPITRYHNKNNIFSFTSETGTPRQTIINNSVVSNHFDKYGPITNFDEVPVTFKNKPFNAIVNVEIKEGEDQFDEKIVLSTPFSSQVHYFQNTSLNRELGLEIKKHKNYSDIKNYYIGIDPSNSIVQTVDSVNISQTIFPKSLYTTKNYTRQRPNFISGYWKNNRENRTELNINNGFGHLIPSQSMWVLDTESNFQSQGLQGDPGSFRIYGPSFATASTTKANAFGFHFPKTTSNGIFLSARKSDGSITETGDFGYTTELFDWAESSNGQISVSSNGGHLVRGLEAYWDSIRTQFTTYGYESVEYSITYNTRRGLYLSDLGNLPNPDNARRHFTVQNIWRNQPAPAGQTETYRQHWFSCSVDCGLTFWNVVQNSPVDCYGTLLFDVSSSVDANGTRGINSISEDQGVEALRRQVYFSTSSVTLPDFTSGTPRLVVRLGTKWFKNDGTIHYGNIPASGAVEFIFDAIYTTNNPVGIGNNLKPILGRQQHYYLSLSQSMIAADLNPSGAVQLAINGVFMSASSVNDQWGFFNGPGSVPTTHQQYTASSWTAADTGSAPTDIFWFQAGNFLDNTYMNEMYFSDIAIISGCLNHNALSSTAMNNKIKRFCGDVTGTESETNGNTGLRFSNYSEVCNVTSELSGPFLWYDFEKTHEDDVFDYTTNKFGVSSSNMQYGTHYDYSGSGDINGAYINISGYVDDIGLGLKIDNGSYADFVITPGTGFDNYLVELSRSNAAAPHTIQNFVSPDDVSVPIGGSTGFNSFKGAGILQNSYSQFARSFSKSTAVDVQFSASCFYSRRHSLTGAASVVNPFFTNLSGGTIYPLLKIHKFLGTAKWEAGEQAGYFDESGVFISDPKTPFYDTYGEFSEQIRGLGKNYSIIPEFKINDNLEFYLSHGPLDSKNNFLELSGGLETLKNSSQEDFYKIYSNSEFLNLFDIVKQDHKKLFDPYRITLSCKGIKKFLPYEGFYPAQRTTQIAQQFYSSYGSNLTITSSGDYPGEFVEDNNYPVQYLLNPLFGPGVLFNTIKSGIACDYPVITSSINTSTEDDIEYYINDTFDQRIPFEALVEPEKYLANISLFSNEPDSLGNTLTEVLWNGQGDDNYKLQMNNFLAEVGDFFLENENYTTITSLPQGDPNFGNAEGGKAYCMRLKMFRTITGSKSPQESHTGIKFGVPQDTGSMGEAFTMYSRPTAFGPPTHHSASSFRTKNWNAFKKSNSVDFIYSKDTAYLHVTSSGGGDGYNYPFTPPYYHGEAWADITFVPTDGTKKYTLPEIINNSSVEFYRYFESGSFELYNSSSVINNEMAMQIASSMNIFSKGVLRQDIQTLNNVTVDTQFENKYRWIIQSKFECPTLNFNHHSHDTITMPNIATSSVPIGMWHQYGRLPQNTNEGIFIQVEEVPRNWTEGALQRDFDTTGSLLNLCGFSTDPVRVGEIKDTKIIEEAVVAIPFVTDINKNKFFKININDVNRAINGEVEKVGDTVTSLVKQLRKYVFPPQFDFVSYKDVEPVVMYVFEFSHKLTKQDLADIWQNLPPKIGTTHEQSTSTISHELFSQEFFGSGAKFSSDNKMQKITKLSNIDSKMQWMVFKVKKRARSNYFEKMFERNESGADVSSEEIVATALGRKQKIAYNWPYDFFSLVELIKIDAKVDFGNIDSEESQRLDDTILLPTQPTIKS